MSETFPDTVTFSFGQLVLHEVLATEYMIVQNGQPRGGSYIPSRTTYHGPHWKWSASLMMWLTRPKPTWALPQIARAVVHVPITPTVPRTRLERVAAFGGLLGFGFTIPLFFKGMPWTPLLYLVGFLLTWWVAPRIRTISFSDTL